MSLTIFQAAAAYCNLLSSPASEVLLSPSNNLSHSDGQVKFSDLCMGCTSSKTGAFFVALYLAD